MRLRSVQRAGNRCGVSAGAGFALLIAFSAPAALAPVVLAQQPNEAAVIRMVDAAVQRRVDNVLAFTDREHYRVYRGKGAMQPAAEMTAVDSYTKGVGKKYTILAQSGSDLVQKYGLRPLIDNETEINKPGNAERSWITSANYEMKLKGAAQPMDGRTCYALAIKPKSKAPNLIDGTLWVDARDGTIVRLEGTASKSPSRFAHTTHMMRQYVNIEGHAMATHARAESSSMLFGSTVVLIDYTDYRLQIRNSSLK
jgi:hypothetical protein